GSAGPAQTVSLEDAATMLGAPVVLPATELIGPSGADQHVRAYDCPSSGDTRYPCVLDVHFPKQSIVVEYVRPVPGDLMARDEGAGRDAVDLNGVPGAWFDYPGVKRGIDFVVGGTRIDVVTSSNYDKSTLESIAQSIVTRSPASSPTQGEGPAGPPPATVAN